MPLCGLFKKKQESYGISICNTLSGYHPEAVLVKKIRYNSLNNAQRINIVNQMLLKTRFDVVQTCGAKGKSNVQMDVENDKFDQFSSVDQSLQQKAHKVGIQNLINDKVYDACFPLHEEIEKATGTDRSELNSKWANFWKWYEYQPLNLIRKYLGEKVCRMDQKCEIFAKLAKSGWKV